MGKRYTGEEISQIQVLTQEGHTIREIAEMMGRPEAGIRNIRHRLKLMAKTHRSLETLRQDEVTLNKHVIQLRRNIQTLDLRRQEVRKVLNTEERALDTKLQTALYKMKDLKPELFNITLEDQIAKMTVELTKTFLKLIVS